jgi:hypothetical protein
MSDDTYDPKRVELLRVMLRDLARHLLVLDAEGRLLEDVAALQKRLGDVRSELFRYEVRTTFDSPETAEHRRIVEDAARPWAPGDASEPDEEDGWPKDAR